MKTKAFIPALLIAFAVPPDATARTGIPAPAQPGSDQALQQNTSDRSSLRQRTVSRKRAANIARQEIRRIEGQASRGLRVTGIQPEDDFGARWEIEVRIPRLEVEYDVYVSPAGSIVNVVRREEASDRGNPQTTRRTANLRSVRASALEHIQQLTGQTNARVTGVEREDDYGARWEVEVTLANGLEYDVYIARDGSVIRAEENGFNYDNWTPGDGVGSIERDQAAANALAHIQQETGQSNARVTGIEYEDDHGAWWEVEVMLPNGFEYDVYVAQNGQVVRVKEKGLGSGTSTPGNDTPTPGNGTVSTERDKAAAIALAHIRQTTGQNNARVTGVTAEDDYGARWEVEVTLPNRLEYDVYVARDGRVVRVIRSNG